MNKVAISIPQFINLQAGLKKNLKPNFFQPKTIAEICSESEWG